MNFRELLLKKNARPYLEQARFGIEREGQRVTLTGELAETDHPAVLGNRGYHPYIQTDFSETQLELITPVAASAEELFDSLEAIHDVAMRSLAEGEMLWPLSMPPALPEKDESIMIAKLSSHADVLYRRYLARQYGKRKQMVSGIHFNFEFDDSLIKALYEEQTELSFSEFKTAVYLKTARNYLRYRWLITYLYGASPTSEARYFKNQEKPTEPVRSIRNSRFGYTNKSEVVVSYSSLSTYIDRIETMIETGKLSEEKEFYAPVRFRGGEKVVELKEKGIRYIELRNIDNNPFERVALSREQVRFLHLFLLFMLWTKEEKAPDEWVAEGDWKNDQTALENPVTATSFQEEGTFLFDGMETMLHQLGMEEDLPLLQQLRRQLNRPDETIAGKLYLQSQASSQKEVAVALGKHYYEMAHERPYQLAGFREMELSTQLLLFDAIQTGIGFQVLDRQDQFVRLQVGKHIEFVKNANMTSKDSYVVPLMMENKVVTKKVLAEAGFRVPQGLEFTSLQEAERAYGRFAEQAFVIKPKSTNYGLGITIFKQGATMEDYRAGLAIAFQEDEAVLVEEFMPGTEYRFFVIDHEVQAILLRIPANVVGDGRSTVKELVDRKNQDPLRGEHHRSPLEKIQLGELEQLMLKEQGLTIDSVPKQNQVVSLRENSNISTGGDSIDVTEDFSDQYKDLAVQAVDALGAVISGIDLIIPDATVDPEKEANAYGIIEANFNPAMHMHIYPYKGTGQRLTKAVLKLLYPEIWQINQWT